MTEPEAARRGQARACFLGQMKVAQAGAATQ